MGLFVVSDTKGSSSVSAAGTMYTSTPRSEIARSAIAARIGGARPSTLQCATFAQAANTDRYDDTMWSCRFFTPLGGCRQPEARSCELQHDGCQALNARPRFPLNVRPQEVFGAPARSGSLPRHGVIRGNLHFLLIVFAPGFGPEQAQHDDEEHWHQENREKGRRKHAADDAGADRILTT
jgi:hypothetical protein